MSFNSFILSLYSVFVAYSSVHLNMWIPCQLSSNVANLCGCVCTSAIFVCFPHCWTPNGFCTLVFWYFRVRVERTNRKHKRRSDAITLLQPHSKVLTFFPHLSEQAFVLFHRALYFCGSVTLEYTNTRRTLLHQIKEQSSPAFFYSYQTVACGRPASRVSRPCPIVYLQHQVFRGRLSLDVISVYLFLLVTIYPSMLLELLKFYLTRWSPSRFAAGTSVISRFLNIFSYTF